MWYNFARMRRILALKGLSKKNPAITGRGSRHYWAIGWELHQLVADVTSFHLFDFLHLASGDKHGHNLGAFLRSHDAVDMLHNPRGQHRFTLGHNLEHFTSQTDVFLGRLGRLIRLYARFGDACQHLGCDLTSILTGEGFVVAIYDSGQDFSAGDGDVLSHNRLLSVVGENFSLSLWQLIYYQRLPQGSTKFCVYTLSP